MAPAPAAASPLDGADGARSRRSAADLQMLLYPMLDDRLETSSSQEFVDVGVFDAV